MRKAMKTTLAVLASLAFIPAAAAASYRVGAPLPGTVLVTTYQPSGSYHGAVDISSGAACGYWGVQTGVVGSMYWNVIIRTTADACSGSGSGSTNEVKHTFANDYVFRQFHFIKTAASVDKTCDRCLIGNEGGTGSLSSPYTHLQYDRYGSLNTAWFAGYTVQGEFLDRGETVGYIQ